MGIKYGLPKTVQCMHCGADNPPTAYCCLSCFKVIKPKTKTPFWKVQIQPTVPSIVIVFTVFLLIVYMLKHWMENIDAQVTMNFQSADYSLSLMADKKRKKALLDVTSRSSAETTDAGTSVEGNPPPPSNP